MNRPSARWEDPRTVAGFTSGTPNMKLLAFAERFVDPARASYCLDIGCGAARNTIPLAALGFRVVGTDLSVPMLDAARLRIHATPGSIATCPGAIELARAPMRPLPFRDAVFDLVVAHGIWNLARSGTELRAAVAEAARVARPGAGLFLFTFSRRTIAPGVDPDPGETFVFSAWNGEPQCFLTEDQIVAELARAGFARDVPEPLTEYNVPRPGEIRTGGAPVIYEGTFIRQATAANERLEVAARQSNARAPDAQADTEPGCAR